MDLFNKKKLIEKEAEISQLRENVLILENEIVELKEEKNREYKLHQDVVDTLLGEVQALIVDNNHKGLSLRTIDTLLPLIKDILDSNKFIVNLSVSPPPLIYGYRYQGIKHKAEVLSSYCKRVVRVWKENGLIETSFCNDVVTDFDESRLFKGFSVEVSSKFSQKEFYYKVQALPMSEYSFKTDAYRIYMRDIKLNKYVSPAVFEISYDFKLI